MGTICAKWLEAVCSTLIKSAELSAGWGLIAADFLTPKYDITFSAQADGRGMAPITLLTACSSGSSICRISRGAEFHLSQVELSWPSRSIKAVPTIWRNIEPRWLPPPECACPRC